MMNAFDLCSGLILTLIICSGIVGNVISFLVWTKGRRCRKLPGGTYLRALAVSDTVALCIPAFNEAITLMTEYNPANNYDFLCRLEITGRHFGLMVSSWIIVCFTVERTLAIARPTTSSNLLSKKGTMVIMIAIFVVNFIMNFPFGIVYGHTTKQIVQPSTQVTDLSGNDDNSTTGHSVDVYKNVCSADRASFFHLLNWYHIWFIDAFLIFLIPFGIITISNLVVLYLVISSRRATGSKMDSKIRAVTVRAVTISVTHCVTTGGFSMLVLIPGYFDRALNIKNSPEYYIRTINLVLSYVNHAVNFILYSFFGSDFRRDCAEVLFKRPAVVHPEGSAVRPSGVMVGDDRSGTGDSHPTQTVNNSLTGKTNISTIST